MRYNDLEPKETAQALSISLEEGFSSRDLATKIDKSSSYVLDRCRTA